MINPKNGSTLASWQLISLGASFSLILGLSSCGSPQKLTESSGDRKAVEGIYQIVNPKGKPQKISDKEVLTDSAVFDTQFQIARQSEARNNVGALIRALQAYYLERREFTSSLVNLGIGIPDETTNYKYTIDVIDRQQLAQVIATSKQEDLKSYLGIVFLVMINNQDATQAIACESLQPTTAIPPRPSNGGRDTGTQTCPDGYRYLGG